MVKQTATPPNWVNRTIWTGDNLDIMRGMNSGSVDLIYLAPPFNSNRTYAAPISSEIVSTTWIASNCSVARETLQRETAPKPNS